MQDLLDSYTPNFLQNLAYLLIFSIGIIHGSNDISLIKVVVNKKKLFNRYTIFYILVIYMWFGIFYSIPKFALLFLMLISCYHFGEQHFFKKNHKSNPLTKLLYFSYGSLIFSMLFCVNHKTVSLIIFELVHYRFTLSQLQFFLVFSLLLFILVYIINLKNFKEDVNHFNELILLLVFSVIFKITSLLWGFTIYFIVWHSIPSIKDQINVLYGSLNNSSLFMYVKTSLKHWVLSLIILLGLYQLVTYFQLNLFSIFFSFLTAIIVPHVVVMYVVNER